MSDVEYKQCTKCEEWKPATPEFFYRKSSNKDGFKSRCKTCEKEYYRQYYHDNRDAILENHRQYRQENHEARLEYNRQYYHDNRDAQLERKRQHYQDNKEHYRQYYQDNREERLEYRRQYYRDNHESRLEYYRQRYQDNREAYIEYHRQRYQDNPEYFQQYRRENREAQRLHTQKRNARKRSLPDTLTQEQIDRMYEYFGNTCPVCGTKYDMFIKPELDHWIPLSSDECPGTVATNIIPLCGGSSFNSHIGCNPSKSNADAMEWLESRFSKRKAKQIYNQIMDYFVWVQEQDN